MNKTRGFTLIELIVVVLIIGILAAIAIIGYGAITDNARSKAYEADVKQVVTAISAAKTQKDGAPFSAGEVNAILDDAGLRGTGTPGWEASGTTVSTSADERAAKAGEVVIHFDEDVATAKPVTPTP